MHRDWIPGNLPHAETIASRASEWMADGGSCIAGPDGQWVIEPRTGEEFVACADLDLEVVYRERQNFDPAGHYSRPDVTRLVVDRRRQNTVSFED